ncbi:hypothetical protein LG314_00560 [Agrococcus terreus]|uniref:hypothetical protein n=1 Tax=Agrococcus terreus TaxID=574649 RepID=UPI00384B059F
MARVPTVDRTDRWRRGGRNALIAGILAGALAATNALLLTFTCRMDFWSNQAVDLVPATSGALEPVAPRWPNFGCDVLSTNLGGSVELLRQPLPDLVAALVGAAIVLVAIAIGIFLRLNGEHT